ncbi:MAG: two pore domain potassium channel family protein [Anaerolineae bacterium]|nr:two pore domain potassium channel family protein [Anaerolineae bacterium]
MKFLNAIFTTDRHKALFLLVIILAHNLIYPLSTGGGIGPLIFYLIFGTMFVFPVFMLSQRRSEHILITISGVVVFFAGVTNSYTPGTLALPVLYVSVIIYHMTIAVVLVRYIFVSEHILLEVVLTATSLYLIIGSVFTPMYGLIELMQPGSFVSSSGALIDWQLLLYYSYVTLTSVGYGDITPAKYYAQAFASFEAIVGVLYTVILLSRLINAYENERSSQ